VVSIPACHAGDPGSIPGNGDFFSSFIFGILLQLLWWLHFAYIKQNQIMERRPQSNARDVHPQLVLVGALVQFLMRAGTYTPTHPRYPSIYMHVCLVSHSFSFLPISHRFRSKSCSSSAEKTRAGTDEDWRGVGSRGNITPRP
jgi:hypothetical protein